MRQATAEALARIGDETAVAPLIDRLDDAKAHVRQASAGALGILGDRRALARLSALASRDPNAFVRRAAADAAERLGRRR